MSLSIPSTTVTDRNPSPSSLPESVPSTPSNVATPPVVEQASPELGGLKTNAIVRNMKNTAKRSHQPFLYRHLFCWGLEKTFPKQLSASDMGHKKMKSLAIWTKIKAHAIAGSLYLLTSPIAIPVDLGLAAGSRVVRAVKKCMPAPVLAAAPIAAPALPAVFVPGTPSAPGPVLDPETVL